MQYTTGAPARGRKNLIHLFFAIMPKTKTLADRQLPRALAKARAPGHCAPHREQTGRLQSSGQPASEAELAAVPHVLQTGNRWQR